MKNEEADMWIRPPSNAGLEGLQSGNLGRS
jgi:hypothetical protein